MFRIAVLHNLHRTTFKRPHLLSGQDICAHKKKNILKNSKWDLNGDNGRAVDSCMGLNSANTRPMTTCCRGNQGSHRAKKKKNKVHSIWLGDTNSPLGRPDVSRISLLASTVVTIALGRTKRKHLNNLVPVIVLLISDVTNLHPLRPFTHRFSFP